MTPVLARMISRWHFMYCIKCRLSGCLSLRARYMVPNGCDIKTTEGVIMKMTRKHMGILVAAASLSLLAACSKGDDSTPAAETGSQTSQSTTPAPAPAPGAGATQNGTAPSQANKPDSAQKSDSSFTQDAKNAGAAVSDAAGKAADSVSNGLSATGDAIKSGAASADKAIQDTVGNGSANAKPATPTPNEN